LRSELFGTKETGDMRVLQEQLARSHKVAVWGLGYLGYTEILRLQSCGFVPLVWDYQPERLRDLLAGKYPAQAHMTAWSIGGQMPSPDMNRLVSADSPEALFETPIQLFCVPADIGWSVHTEIRDILLANREVLAGKLLIFLSAGVPGRIDDHYMDALRETGCDVAVAFRDDWTFEELLDKTRPQVIAADSARGLESARFFFESMGFKTRSLPSIKAAEILANAENMLQALISTYLNQLAAAFPDTDIRKVSELLLAGYRPRLRHPTLGHLDVRQLAALKHLTAEDATDAALSLAADVQRSSLSTLLSYADQLVDNGVSGVALLGLAPAHAAKRDVGFSSSCLLAEYLHKKGIAVFVCDPAYTDDEIRTLLSFVRPFSLEAQLPADTALIMSEIPMLRRLTSQDLQRLGWLDAKIIIDNLGMLRYTAFSENTVYHVPGDGKLKFPRK